MSYPKSVTIGENDEWHYDNGTWTVKKRDKSELEQTKKEAEQRKIEAERRGIEAEQRKQECEQGKIQIEQRKIEIEQRKEEIEKQKVQMPNKSFPHQTVKVSFNFNGSVVEKPKPKPIEYDPNEKPTEIADSEGYVHLDGRQYFDKEGNRFNLFHQINLHKDGKPWEHNGNLLRPLFFTKDMAAIGYTKKE